MTNDAWAAIKDANSHLAGEFLMFLGECDLQKHFIAQFESETADHAGKWRLGLYCFGLNRSDSGYVESYLERLSHNPSFDKGALLLPIAFIGSTPANRKRLLQLIANKSVAPLDVTNMFRAGRWFEGVPISDVVAIMEYMAQGENWAQMLADVISLYLHLNKPLPKELFPLGERILRESYLTLNDSYDCNQIAIGIARTDLEKGFALLKERIDVLNEKDWHGLSGGWNPLSRYGGHEFWNYLRSENAERAYRYFCTLTNPHIRHEIIGDDARVLLDLENHRPILLKIANENEKDAEQLAFSVSYKQPGFLAFAFELLAGRLLDGNVASRLSSTVVEQDGFGTPLNKLQIALNNIESELKKTGLPEHGRAWLERLKQKVQETIKTSPWNSGEHEFLGWQ
jgi:hypothetical protein